MFLIRAAGRRHLGCRLEHCERLCSSDADEPRHFEQIRPLSIGDPAILPGRAAHMPDVLTVRVLRGLARQTQLAASPGHSGELAVSDVPVFQHPVQHAEVAVKVAARTAGQPIHQADKRRPLGRPPQHPVRAG